MRDEAECAPSSLIPHPSSRPPYFHGLAIRISTEKKPYFNGYPTPRNSLIILPSISPRTVSHEMIILIVEDNPLMRGLIRETVREYAALILECEDGDQAFATYQAHLPHWVLMDIQMPRVDGLTASRQIKAGFPNAQICIVTDYGDAGTRTSAQAAGAKAFVLKENLEELRNLFG